MEGMAKSLLWDVVEGGALVLFVAMVLLWADLLRFTV